MSWGWGEIKGWHWGSTSWVGEGCRVQAWPGLTPAGRIGLWEAPRRRAERRYLEDGTGVRIPDNMAKTPDCLCQNERQWVWWVVL